MPSLDERVWLLAEAMRGRGIAEARVAGKSAEAALLSHVVSTVPRYRRGARGDPPRVDAFPLITRADLIERGHAHISSAFALSDLRFRTTSGTSGIPLSIPRDLGSEYSFAYDTYRVLFDSLPELKGAARAGRVAVLQVRDNPTRPERSVVNPALDYALVRHGVVGRDEATDGLLLASALEERPPLLAGRPRGLRALTELFAARGRDGRDAGFAAVLCSGDNLYPEDRRVLSAFFGAPVYNAYTCREAGLVAIECPRQYGLHVIPERASLEVLVPGMDGPGLEGSGELVVSGWENWAMPVVRYQTGDQGRVTRQPCRCGRPGARIIDLSGRDSTYFTASGRRFNPSLLSETFHGLPLRQFQVTQGSDDTFRFRWVAADQRADAAAMTEAVQAAFEGVGVDRDAVDVERVMRLGGPGEKVQRYVRAEGRLVP